MKQPLDLNARPCPCQRTGSFIPFVIPACGIRVYVLVILAALLAPLVAMQAQALEITLHKEATVTGKHILLGDIASITPAGELADRLAQTRIAHAPEPGKTRELQTSSVKALLRHKQVDGEPRWRGPKTVTVLRQGQVIDREQLKAIIAAYIGANLHRLPDAEFRFTQVRAPEKIILPTGKLTYTVTPSRPEILGSSSFNILFKVDDRVVKNCTVRGRLQAMAEVATAAVSLRRGAILTGDQITMTRQDISHLNNPCLSYEKAIGLQAIRSIRPGQPLDARNVAPPPVIRKGEPVKIFASRGALQISTTGIATADGRPGQFIRVRNIGSNKLVYCRVDAPGIVTVEF